MRLFSRGKVAKRNSKTTMPEMGTGMSASSGGTCLRPDGHPKREEAAKIMKPNHKQVAKLYNECNKKDLYLQYTSERLTLSKHLLNIHLFSDHNLR